MSIFIAMIFRYEINSSSKHIQKFLLGKTVLQRLLKHYVTLRENLFQPFYDKSLSSVMILLPGNVNNVTLTLLHPFFTGKMF